MKTAHQFARELLAGPDLPIAVCDPSADDRKDVCHDPVVGLVEGFDAEDGGESCEMLELYGTGMPPVLADVAIEMPETRD
jgi:hypothetical protein